MTIPHAELSDLSEVAGLLARVHIGVDGAKLERPTLDEVFLQLTDPTRTDNTDTRIEDAA